MKRSLSALVGLALFAGAGKRAAGFGFVGDLVFACLPEVGQRGISQMSGYSATKAAQRGFAESLRTEFNGSNIHVSIVYPISTTTEFRSAMTRDYGHTVAGLGPKQSADHVAQAIVSCLRRPRPEVYPYRPSKLLTIMNAVAPGFTDGFVRRFGRRRTDAP